MPASELDLDAFMAQAMEYENWEDAHDRVRRFFLELGVTHSFAVRRVSEVMRWVQSGEYDRILRGEYRRRGDETDVREEAGEAMEFYAERFRALFRELGENVTNLAARSATPASRSPTGCASAARATTDPRSRPARSCRAVGARAPGALQARAPRLDRIGLRPALSQRSSEPARS